MTNESKTREDAVCHTLLI